MESQGGIYHKRQVCKVEGDEVHHGCLLVRMSFYCDKGLRLLIYRAKKQIVVNIRDIHNKRKQGSDIAEIIIWICR